MNEITIDLRSADGKNNYRLVSYSDYRISITRQHGPIENLEYETISIPPEMAELFLIACRQLAAARHAGP